MTFQLINSDTLCKHYDSEYYKVGMVMVEVEMMMVVVMVGGT